MAGLSCLFILPIDWMLFIEAMAVRMVIASFPRMIRCFGESVLIGMNGLLVKL